MAFQNLPDLPRHRRWRRQVYPAPVVVALIRRTVNDNHHYLLIKRNETTYGGRWALVGGKWDFGETLADAIVREVKEETGLEASFVGVRGVVSERVAPHQSGELGAHFLIFVCELAAPRGTAVEQNEGAVAWFTRRQIEALHTASTIIPSDYAMLQGFTDGGSTVTLVEAEMRAPLGNAQDNPIQLLRFEKIGYA